jgi:hypothetical protein
MVIAGLAATVVAGCSDMSDMAAKQQAYVDQQRRDCTAAGGYYETNKTGQADNYTCKNMHGGPSASPPPQHCHTKTSTVTNPDGSTSTNSTQVCTSF